MFAELCLNATRHFNPSQILSTGWRKSCKQYRMICHRRTLSTRPYWALSNFFKLVWKLGVETLNAYSDKLFLNGFELLASCDSLKCQISMFSFDFNTSTMMKIVIFIVIVLHSTGSVVVQLRFSEYMVYRWIQRSVRIKQLQEFSKSDHWLQRYCILSGGVFYFEPPCRRDADWFCFQCHWFKDWVYLSHSK